MIKTKTSEKQINDAYGSSLKFLKEAKLHSDKDKIIDLWAIIDVSKGKQRFCYADEKKTKGAMAIYDKKPVIEEHWRPFKKVVKVKVEIL